MPAITLSYTDLVRLLKKKVPRDQLTDVLILNKVEIDDASGDEWKLDVTPDRPDLFSAEGIARQLNGWLGFTTGSPPYTVSPPTLILQAGRSALRPCVAAGIVRNVRLDDATVRSLFALQETLDLTLGRGRKKAAIGIHDLAAIQGPVTYKDVPATSRFLPLDGNEEQSLADVLRTHPKGKKYAHLLSGAAYPVFLDQQGIISFAPIINSARTQITSTTTNLFFEMQGSDQRTLDIILNILVTAMADRGGQIEAVTIISDGKTLQKPDLDLVPHTVPVRDIKKMLGIDLKNSEIKQLLERMRYDVLSLGEQLDIMAPAYRADLLHYVDLIEDVAIAYGFATFVPEIPKLATVGSSDPLEDLTNTVREAMVGLGFTETLNFSLTSPEHVAKAGLPLADPITVTNPVSLEYTILRQHLLPSLLGNLAANKHRRYPQQLFETADVTVRDPSADTRASSVRSLCACLTPSDFSGILSILRAAAGALKLDITLANSDHPTFIPGRAGTITLGGRPAGFFGEIHPRILVNFGLKNPVAAFELRLE